MRIVTVAVCVGLLVAAFLPTPVRAEDDDGRLARRVEMLLDLVAEMKAEITELKARVAQLEKELASQDEEPDPLPPFTTVEPQPVPEGDTAEAKAVPDVSGDYDLDVKASVEAVLEKMGEGVEADDLVEMRMMVEAEFSEIRMSLTLTKAGIFEASMEAPMLGEEGEGEKHSARGTWKRADSSPKDGSVRLVLETTHEDGEESDKDETIEGIWRKDGSLRLQQEGDDFILVFQRR